MTYQLSRRQAASLTLASVAGFALTACAGRGQDELQQDVELIANGLTGIVGALANLPDNLRPSADIIAKAQATIDDIKANAALIGSALTPNASTINAISNGVTTLAALLTPFFPAAPIVAMVLQAALALVPTLLGFLASPTPPPAGAALAARKVTPTQAKAVLSAAPAMLKR